MFRIVLGFLLIVAAISSFMFLLQDVDDSPALAEVLDSLHCRPGETIRQTFGGASSINFRVNGRAVAYTCINDARVERDVTAGVMLTIFAGFGVPLVTAILFIIWGAVGHTRRAARRLLATDDLGTFSGAVLAGDDGRVTFRTGSRDRDTVQPANLPPAAARLVQQLLEGMSSAGLNAAVSGGDLADRLEQLQEARDRGFITEDEYQRLRQRILDSLGS